MKKFSNFIVKNRWWVIVTWLVVAVIIIALSPSISSVESNNQTGFLPKGYESIQAYNNFRQPVKTLSIWLFLRIKPAKN